MNLALPNYRNCFHPIWVLLVGLPLVGLGLVTWNFDGMSLAAFLGQVVLAALVVGPMVLWRMEVAPPAARRWMKEMRSFLVPLLISVGVPDALGLLRLLFPTVDFGSDTGNWMISACVLGSLVAGATAFGEEFEHRTLGALLSQPRSRWNLYGGKLAPLAIVLVWSGANLGLLLAGFGNFQRGGELQQMIQGWVLLAFVFCTAPWYTLLTRSTLAGAIFTAAVPLLAVLGGVLVVEVVEWRTGSRPEAEMTRWMFRVIPLYLVGSAALGWRTFRGLQVREGGGGGASTIHHPLSIPVDRLLGGFLPRGAFGQLLRKEARLHMVPWLVAAMMVACWGVALGVRWMRSGDPDASGSFNFEMVGVLFVIMGMLTLLISGAACVAEERGLGTLEWQLTQPTSVTRQWWVKILVAWGHFLLLGALLPAGLYLGLAGGKTAWPENASDFLLPAIVYGGVVVLVFSLAVYASSFSRSTMKAVAATLGLGLLIGLVPMPFVAWVGVRMDRLGTEFESGPVPAPAWEPGRDLVVGIGAVLLGLSVVGTMVLLLILGRRNFARASVSGSMLSRQLLGLVLWMIPLLLVTTECFLRLSRLEVQGNFHRMQETQKSRVRAALRSLLDWQLARNSVNDEFLRSFGLRTPASPRDVLGAVENIGDPGTGEQWVRILLVDVLRSAGVTNASAIENEVHSLVAQGFPPVRLIERRIREEAVRAKAAETSPHRSQYFRMDPFLARRYGLLPKAGSSPSTSDPKVTNPPTVPMDPDMARRYGLTPAAPKTEKAAPPP